jgi:hypothetical protein
VDKKTFLDLWRREPERISSTLVCDIYASAILYWHKSDVLKHHHKPDPEFSWNLAVKALQDDFMAPSISTVHSALLDMGGRPTLQISGNIVNAGRTVTLAHSLGLHRDLVGWEATDHEKQVRINLWWGCLIQDHWYVNPSWNSVMANATEGRVLLMGHRRTSKKPITTYHYQRYRHY